MKCKYDIVLFDLDGTLSNSAQGVQDGIKAALKQMNKPVPDLSDTSLYIGPPLLSTFEGLCGLKGSEIETAMELYIKDYEENGKLKNYMYEGLDKLIDEIRKSGAKAVVATSKFEPFAYEVIKLIGLEGRFDAICGANRDGTRKEKAQVIRYAMKTLNSDDYSRAVLIGDTKFDAEGAKKTGCDFIGVTYGFGKKEQMAAMGANKFSETVQGLYKLLFQFD